MSCVIVGVDPHKKSVTIEAIDEQEKKLATGRFGTDTRDYKAMLGYVRRQWPHHRWAIEGAHGVGRPLAQRLLADGETVVDVPPSSRLGCGSSTPATHGRPTPPTPTRSRP
jgi:transposase